MSDTFKQQVIRIGNDYICRDCNEREGCKLIPEECVFLQEFLELILSAHNAELDRIAEGMQFKKCWQPQISGHITPVEAYKLAVSECQAYIQAQKGS